MTGSDLVEDLARRGFVDLVEVGHGGFAVVYRALQQEYGRTVAVKVLSGGVLDEESLERFNRELRAMGLLSNHPNIVTVYSAGVTNRGWAYLVMEYVSRGSLADRLLRSGRLTWEQSAEIGVKLAAALETSHRLGVLHRDVKPENVLLSAFGEPLLGDFGIARVTGSLVTSSNVQKVTIAHAPPEVFDGERQSAQADVYSLASTLMTLVLGRPPFVRPEDESILPLYARISREPPPDLRPLGVPPPLCEALERAMAKDPDQRQASAFDFGQELRAAQRLCGQPPTTMPVGGADDDQVTVVREPAQTSTDVPARPVVATTPGTGPPPRAPAAAVLSVARTETEAAPAPSRARPPGAAAPAPLPPAPRDPRHAAAGAPSSRRGGRIATLIGVPAVGALALAAVLTAQGGPTAVHVPNDGLAVGQDVWVLAGPADDASLLRLDAASGELLGGPQNDFPLEGLQAIAEGVVAEGSQVWGLNRAGRQIAREQVASTEVETDPVEGDAEAIEVDGGQVWVAHVDGQTSRVSIFSTNGTFLHGSDAGERPPEGRALSLDVQGGVGWVATGSSDVTRIAADGTSRTFVLDQRALAVAAVGDDVLVATDQGEVLRFPSPSEAAPAAGGTRLVAADRLVVREGEALDQIVANGEAVWVAGPGTGVWRAPVGLDGTAEQLDVPEGGPKVIALGATGLWVADPERGRLHHVRGDGAEAEPVDLASVLGAGG